jgi:hypothetical protein
MKRTATYLASAALGTAVMVASGSAWAQMGAAPGEMGNYCATPVKTCMLRHPYGVGYGCECRVPGGHAQGTVASTYGYSPSNYAYGNPFGWLTAPVGAAASVPVAAAGAATAPLTSNPYGYPYNYYSYNYGYSYGNPFGWPTAPIGAAAAAPVAAAQTAAAVPAAVAGAATAPLMTGRSAAEIGRSCSTPKKTCELREASYVGVGCSCHVPGGRARGSVTP